MALTRQVLRRGLSQLMGDFILDPDGSVPTCSSQGGASGATAIDALRSYYDDDYFNDWFFLLPSGPSSGSTAYGVTRITDFVSSTGVMSLTPNAAAQIESGQTYELHRYSPAWKHLALNAAREQASDVLYFPHADETLVVDNRLSNADGETFSTTFTSWTHTAGTWTQEGTIVRHGDYSFKGVASGANAKLTQHITTRINMDEIKDKTITFKMWIYATAADKARIQLDYDGGTTVTSSDYHGGKYEWELIEIVDVVPEDANQITVTLEVVDGSTAYFDAGWVAVGVVHRYDMPSNLFRGPRTVEQQIDENRPEGDFTKLTRNNPPRAGRILRLTGKRMMSELSVDADSMEVSAPESQILYAHALEWLANSQISMASGVSRSEFETDRTRWLTLAADLRQRTGVRGEPIGFYAEQNGVWEYAHRGETDYLVLKNR